MSDTESANAPNPGSEPPTGAETSGGLDRTEAAESDFALEQQVRLAVHLIEPVSLQNVALAAIQAMQAGGEATTSLQDAFRREPEFNRLRGSADDSSVDWQIVSTIAQLARAGDSLSVEAVDTELALKHLQVHVEWHSAACAEERGGMLPELDPATLLASHGKVVAAREAIENGVHVEPTQVAKEWVSKLEEQPVNMPAAQQVADRALAWAKTDNNLGALRLQRSTHAVGMVTEATMPLAGLGAAGFALASFPLAKGFAVAVALIAGGTLPLLDLKRAAGTAVAANARIPGVKASSREAEAAFRASHRDYLRNSTQVARGRS